MPNSMVQREQECSATLPVSLDVQAAKFDVFNEHCLESWMTAMRDAVIIEKVILQLAPIVNPV